MRERVEYREKGDKKWTGEEKRREKEAGGGVKRLPKPTHTHFKDRYSQRPSEESWECGER